MLTYNIELNFNDDNQRNYWLNLLEVSKEIYNYVSSIVKKENIRPSIKFVHDRCYYEVREKYPDIHSQIIIKIEQELHYNSGIQWQQKADRRRDLINMYCWDEHRGVFVDYNYITDTLNPIISYATFYPMLWGFASQEQARRIVKNLHILETSNGIRFCQYTESPISYQWNHNSIWPPVQYVCYRALDRYGYDKDARRIAKTYLSVITKNYKSPEPASYMDHRNNIVIRESGNLYEKYHINGKIFDYADYPAGQMIGWCGGVFSDALHFITKER